MVSAFGASRSKQWKATSILPKHQLHFSPPTTGLSRLLECIVVTEYIYLSFQSLPLTLSSWTTLPFNPLYPLQLLWFISCTPWLLSLIPTSLLLYTHWTSPKPMTQSDPVLYSINICKWKCHFLGQFTLHQVWNWGLCVLEDNSKYHPGIWYWSRVLWRHSLRTPSYHTRQFYRYLVIPATNAV